MSQTHGIATHNGPAGTKMPFAGLASPLTVRLSVTFQSGRKTPQS